MWPHYQSLTTLGQKDMYIKVLINPKVATKSPPSSWIDKLSLFFLTILCEKIIFLSMNDIIEPGFSLLRKTINLLGICFHVTSYVDVYENSTLKIILTDYLLFGNFLITGYDPG